MCDSSPTVHLGRLRPISGEVPTREHEKETGIACGTQGTVEGVDAGPYFHTALSSSPIARVELPPSSSCSIYARVGYVSAL